MADASLASLPAPLQTALTWGAGIAATLLPVLAYFKRSPKAQASPDSDAKTVAVAVAAPLGDPNQLRQVVEELHRLNDHAERIHSLADDLKDGQGRGEEANNRQERALRDLISLLSRR